MAKLVRENVIETREGRKGGYILKKDPKSLTLAEVYLALGVGDAQYKAMLDTTCKNEQGIQMRADMTAILGEMDRSIVETLKKFTIADLAHKNED